MIKIFYMRVPWATRSTISELCFVPRSILNSIFLWCEAGYLLECAVETAVGRISALRSDTADATVGILQKIAGVINLDIAHILRIRHSDGFQKNA